MHQVRYFLAVAQSLNFTRAAEECNVAQPSLTRAVKLLEIELGGDLFRRERNLSHLTELGTRMLPLLQQCYDSANSAKTIAKSLKSGAITPLMLGMSRGFPIESLLPSLGELLEVFKGLEIKFVRGTAPELTEALKKGDVELAIAGPLGETWERLESWPLFTSGFDLLVHESHPLAACNRLTIDQLRNERILSRSYCEVVSSLHSLLREHGVTSRIAHHVASEEDLRALVEAKAGVAIVPEGLRVSCPLKHVHVHDLDLKCAVHVYAVAGRERTAVASTLLKLLRSADWSGQAKAGST
jgi:DNA-binding transcriptional LysR family regulator